jgi:hypothetical protein
MEKLQLSLSLSSKVSGLPDELPTSINPTSGWGNLESGLVDTSFTYWASSTGAQTAASNGQDVIITCSSPISVTITVSSTSGTPLSGLKYIKTTGGVASNIINYTGAISISSGDSLKIAATTPSFGPTDGTGNIVVTDTTSSQILDLIPYSFVIEI